MGNVCGSPQRDQAGDIADTKQNNKKVSKLIHSF